MKVTESNLEMIAEYQKLQQQQQGEGGYFLGLLKIVHLGKAFCSSSI